MGPGEALVAIVSIVSLFIVLPAIMVFAFRGRGGKSKGGEMRKSDLTAMIDEAVEQATEPMRRRIETLEAIAIDEEAEGSRLDAAVLAQAFDAEPLPGESAGADATRARE